MSGFICSDPIYNYKNIYFRHHDWLGITKLNKDLKKAKRTGRVFFEKYREWVMLAKEEREKYRIGGGCVPF